MKKYMLFLLYTIIILNLTTFSYSMNIFLAIKFDDINSIKELLKNKKIDVNQTCNLTHNKGKTPLYLACNKNRLEIVKLLLIHGAIIDRKIMKKSDLKQFHTEIRKYINLTKEYDNLIKNSVYPLNIPIIIEGKYRKEMTQESFCGKKQLMEKIEIFKAFIKNLLFTRKIKDPIIFSNLEKQVSSPKKCYNSIKDCNINCAYDI